ncbi:MAG: DUF6044 family protein [Lachnospiraceae bacterium]|nr:DUF6044 family protein [Lachnospiraceae bacterium]
MKKLKESVLEYWYFWIPGILLGLQAAVFLIFRGQSYPQIHDNLDLFMAHYEMLRRNHLWFAHGAQAPILHGVTRDLFGSELSLYNILYVIFPGIWAYLLGYALKITVGIISFILLCRELLGDRYQNYKPLVILTATAFALIPVFPTYGIAFTSVPLIAWLLVRLYRTSGFKDIKTDVIEKKQRRNLTVKRSLLYLGVFCYPLLSYFSYHGFFILCYMVAGVIILWIKDRKFPKSTFASILILSAGYVIFEYRLFGAMLFDDTVTIRTTMEHGELTLGQALRTALEEFVNASFHSEDSHTYVILGVVLIALFVINAGHIRNREGRKILKDPVNLLMLWILFNVLIFGLYQYAPFRHLFEMIVPQLTGFEFARFAYFNTFLWYAELLMVCIRMYDSGKDKLRMLSNAVVILSLLAVMFIPQVYNDFYYTCYNQAYRILKHKDTSTVNYDEFYSVKLFDRIREETGYNGEWSAAYGMHPAVLNYNGIATVDGYLGMYSQDYKEKWEKVIAPALEGSPSLKSYFEGWGARVCLYSGDDENTYAPLRVMDLKDRNLYVDMDELKSLDCRYIFSRIAFENASELGLLSAGEFSGDGSPYTVYVYRVN